MKHSGKKHHTTHKPSKEAKLASMLAQATPPAPPPQAAAPPVPPAGPMPAGAGPPTPMPPGMNPGQQASNPHETRESGFDTVLIGDGGGTFQRYGGGSMNYYPQDNARAGRDVFSMDTPDKIVRDHTTIKEQIVDTGRKK